VLVFLGMDVPYRHDLDALRNVVPAGWPFTEEHPRLARLTVWIAAGR
jgi:hypothetical protein